MLGYAPGVAAEPPAGAAPPLERTDAMRLALDEVTRLRIVSYYEEVEPGVLVLVLGNVNSTSPAVEESLTRLYAAYADLLGYPDTGPVMELWQNGRKVGEYP